MIPHLLKQSYAGQASWGEYKAETHLEGRLPLLLGSTLPVPASSHAKHLSLPIAETILTCLGYSCEKTFKGVYTLATKHVAMLVSFAVP